ncbi:PH domain-containing protein [Niabella insulamsoli]|uniref:PH domain-containing protein n=1 Tax=Niabella insulamsoli TaxID=3144874 RepID=UPI0031FCE5EB
MMIVYKTRASPLIKLMFGILLVLMTVIAAIEKSMALVAVTAGFCLLVLYIFYATHYTIYEGRLTIKSGFLFRETIDIESIKKVTRKRKHLFSGPGFSIDRLIIEYGVHGCVIISPSQQKAFVAHLKKNNPDITFINLD